MKPLAFDEYCRFYTSAFFMRIDLKRASLYTHKDSSNVRYFLAAKNTVCDDIRMTFVRMTFEICSFVMSHSIHEA